MGFFKDRTLNACIRDDERIIYSFADYFPYDRAEYDRGQHDELSQQIMNLKCKKLTPTIRDRRQQTEMITRFAKLLGLLLNTKKDFVLITVPSSDPDNEHHGITNVVRELLATKDIRIIDGTGGVRRPAFQRSVSAGGPRLSIEKHEANLEVPHPHLFSGKNVLILDDVTTTGNSMKAVRRLVEDAGAKQVCCLALTKTASVLDKDQRLAVIDFQSVVFEKLQRDAGHRADLFMRNYVKGGLDHTLARHILHRKLLALSDNHEDFGAELNQAVDTELGDHAAHYVECQRAFLAIELLALSDAKLLKKRKIEEKVIKQTDYRLIQWVDNDRYINALKHCINKLARHRAHSIYSLTVFSGDLYPRQLADIKRPPIVLFVKGNYELLRNIGRNIAVLGTREAAEPSLKVAEQMARHLVSKHSCVIVSGLAKGCDAAAHRGAEGKTIAVLAGGLDIRKVYPQENRLLAAQIVARGGCLVSEQFMNVCPFRSFFTERNRIQTALSRAVVIVESKEKGGTMHQRNYCTEQNRPLACCVRIPGVGPDSIAGNRRLIAQNIAEPIACPLNAGQLNPESLDRYMKAVFNSEALSPTERASARRGSGSGAIAFHTSGRKRAREGDEEANAPKRARLAQDKSASEP